MDDKQLEALLQESARRSVDAHAGRLEGLEGRVLATLSARLTPRTARRRWLSFPRRHPALGYAFIAAAALAVGLFLGSTWGLPWNGGLDREVTFVVALPEAHSVAVAGDFSGWTPLPLERDKNGNWSLNVDLPPGRYEYAFLVDGVVWKPDPRADEYVESYFSINSVKYVGAKRGAS